MIKGNSEISYKTTKFSQYVASISACLGSLAAGTVLGWTANISEDMKKFSYNGIEIDNDSLGWIGSLAILGGMFSMVPISILSNLIGRKRGMLLLTLPFMTGWLLIIFAKYLWMIYFGRFLTGLGGFAFVITIPMYISEIAEKNIRGRLAVLYDLHLSIGISLAYIIATLVNMYSYTIIVASLPVIFAIAFSFQPESPVYSAIKNNDTKAKKSLLRLRGKSCDIETEFQTMKLSIVEDKRSDITFLQSIKKKSTKKSIFVCFTLMFLQQAGGINVLIFYAETIFEATGIGLSPKISTVIFGCLEVTASFLATIAVDKLGRRILLMSSNLISALAIASLAIFFTLHDRKIVDENTIASIGLLPVISLCTYIMAFAFGMSPLPYILLAEILPPEIKGTVDGCAGTFNLLIAFLITKFYFNVQSVVGSDITFYVFSAVAFLTTIFVYYCVPETKGRTLEQIQKELNE